MHRLVEKRAEYILQFCTTKEKVYEFLHDDIFRLRQNGLSILAQLLVADKIEKADIEELFSSIQANMYRQNNWVSFEDKAVLSTLIANGYFDVFLKDYLSADMVNNISKMGTICYRTDFYISHMYVMPIGESVVNQLINVLGPGKSCPYTLSNRFKNELLRDEVFFAKLKAVADQNKIQLPNEWIA